MTRPVEEFEISALIDGELEPSRAAEVRAAIEADPSLRAEYERIRAADEVWTTAGRSARFMPAIQWHLAVMAPGGVLAGAAFAIMLAVGRSLLKFLPMDLSAGMAVHGLMLAVTVAVVIWVCRRLEGRNGSEQAGAAPG